jgi:hypothetical protein
VRLLASRLVDAGGGGANSLKVVNESDCEAVLWMASSTCASCSLSAWETALIEAIDARRERNPSGRLILELDMGEGGTSLVDMVLKSPSFLVF